MPQKSRQRLARSTVCNSINALGEQTQRAVGVSRCGPRQRGGEESANDDPALTGVEADERG